jgi:hypothetical protein
MRDTYDIGHPSHRLADSLADGDLRSCDRARRDMRRLSIAWT